MTEHPALDANIGDIVKARNSKSKVTHVVVDRYGNTAYLRSTTSARRTSEHVEHLTIIERAGK